MITENNVSLNTLISQRLQQIANVLLINSSFIDNLGLLNGKMGIAIFFYQYARFTNSEIYEKYAGELIDEIYEEISFATPIDFASGLTGIGWGIEYLVQNGFVEANTDEAMAEFDNHIFRATMQFPISIHNQTELFGFGLFYLARLKGREQDNDNLQTVKKKQLLIYMMDECERLLTKESLFDTSVPMLTLYQLNSLVWFIIQTRILGLFPIKSNKLVIYLADYASNKMENVFDPIDVTIFQNLIDQLKPLVQNADMLRMYEILQTLFVTLSTDCRSDEQLINQYIKSGWCPLLYNLDFPIAHYKKNEKVLAIIKSEENWNRLFDKLNNSNIGLDMGMAGLGMALLNEGMKRSNASISEYANVTMNDHITTVTPNNF